MNIEDYKAYIGFYDLKDFILPKRIFIKLWRIQDLLAHMRDKAEYYKRWHPNQWQKAKEICAQYQQILFQHDRHTA